MDGTNGTDGTDRTDQRDGIDGMDAMDHDDDAGRTGRLRRAAASAALPWVALLLLAGPGAGLACAESGSRPEGVGRLKPDEAELRERLTPEQYAVTRQDATEPAFRNAWWDHHEPGIYVDVVSGEPLFSSTHKFDSGTGWPSFTRPLEPGNVYTREDRKLLVPRTEVRSRGADSHLGHVFQDGPAPRGERWCINSAALRFVPAERLEEEGYGEYRELFEEAPGSREVRR